MCFDENAKLFQGTEIKILTFHGHMDQPMAILMKKKINIRRT